MQYVPKPVGTFEDYDVQRIGLGDFLICELVRTIALVVEEPEAWRLVHSSGIRCIGLSRFPYAVF